MNIANQLLACFIATILSLSSSLDAAKTDVKLEPKKTKGKFLIYDFGKSGMFAEFCAVLGALDYYEGGYHAGIKIDLCHGVYLDPEVGSNWWEYFFEPIHFGNENASKYTFTLKDHFTLSYKGVQMPRLRAYELIQRYVKVLPHIQEKVDNYVSLNFENHFVIGVHRRGTDKGVEVPLVPYHKTIGAISSVINQLSPEQRSSVKIYIATDDANFITHAVNIFGDLVIYNDFVRSSDETPLHYGNDARYQNNYQKGEEALIDCLLLSRSQHLIRPWSSLSIAADHFNPFIPVTILEEK